MGTHQLHERAHQLTALHDALGRVMDGRSGVLVLFGGEAGGGKTALIRQFCAECRPVDRVLWGACDPLFTPRPLGPFVDIADDLGGELATLVNLGARPHQIAAAVARDAQTRQGTIVVLEDLHWADEATLDVLSVLGRRIASTPALVIASYRDDELDRHNPQRGLLGELRGPTSVRRLAVRPLSVEAVTSLAEPHGVDGAALHRATGGNPFFVTEVLAAPGWTDGDIPPTVRDAVIARTARLSSAARTVVDAVSVALPQAELWLLDALAPDAAEALDECLSAGVLEVRPGGVAFRHELARKAIEETLSPHRREALHRGALRVLAAPPAGPPDLARLAYHAEAAGDAAAVLDYAPAAATHAASIGAHREAADHFRRALRFGDGLTPGARATLLEALSHEAYVTDQSDTSIEALQRAIGHWRATGEDALTGAGLAQLARRLWCAGRSADAETVGWEAVRLLEAGPRGPELALAYGTVAANYMNDERLDETLSWGTRALSLAEAVGATPVMVQCLNDIGTMELLAGRPEGLSKLERSLALAERAGLDDHVGRAFIHLGWAMTRTRSYDLAPWLDRGVEVCADLGLEGWELYVVAHRARYHLDAGRWDAAAADATFVLRSVRTVPLLSILALTVLGLVRTRRGDPEHYAPLDRAADLLAGLPGQAELQYRVPVGLARAEAAWLDGRGSTVEAATDDLLARAVERDAAWVVGELAWLRRLAGVRETVTGATEPYASQLAGDGTTAAKRWTELGCPYDAALALVESDDVSDLRFALAEFQRLGARPAAAVVTRRLRAQGVRAVPQGPRRATDDHPAGLTRREAEVLAHLQRGSSNADIAAALFLSPKTVHHHVSAILRKLGVDSRGKAASEATRRGLTLL